MKDLGAIRFKDVLRFYMKRDSITVDGLAAQTERLFGKYQRVPKSTIVNWLEHGRTPRNWEPVIKVAAGLHLTRDESIELLTSAGFPLVFDLAMTVEGKLKVIMENWDEIVPRAIFQSRTALLHQLPPPPRDFTGRTREITKALATAEQSPITGVFGAGGVGKTVLALKLATAQIDKYPDAQLFIRLGGLQTNPLSDSQALQHVIRALEPDRELPETVRELEVLFYSALNGKRILLLLDGASGAWQVRSMIPPEGCMLIVTSRERFTLPGMYVIDLGMMPISEAHTFLRRISGLDEVTARKVAKFCGYWPLALRLIGSAFATQPDLDPDMYLEQLAHSPFEVIDAAASLAGEEKGTEISLEISYSQLSQKDQILWSQLAVCAGDFDKSAAATIWELDRDATSAILSTLLQRSLVDWNPKTSRYRLHDLAHRFANQKLVLRPRINAQSNHALHYLNVLRDAVTLYEKGGESARLAVVLYERERGNISAAHEWCTAHITEGIAPALSIDYALVGAPLLTLRQPVSERIAWLRLALSSARSLGNRDSEGILLHLLGKANKQAGSNDIALECFEQALIIFAEQNKQIKVGAIFNDMGSIYRERGNLSKAIDQYEQCLTIMREMSSRRNEGAVLGNLGTCYSRMGNYAKAIEHCEQQYAIAKEVGDSILQSNALNDIGLDYFYLGNPALAISYYKRALVLKRQTGDLKHLAGTLNNLGWAYATIGRPWRAGALYLRALKISRDIGARRQETDLLGNLGMLCSQEGKFDQALIYLEQQYAISIEIGFPRGVANASKDMGTTYMQMGDISRAEQLLEQSLVLFQEISDKRGESETFVELAKVSMASGDNEPALSYSEQAIRKAKELGETITIGNALWIKARVHWRRNERQEAITLLKESISHFEQSGAMERIGALEELAKWQDNAST